MSAAREVVVARPEGIRRALLREPPGPDTGRRRPAVMLLHGAGGTAKLALENTGWTRIADREGLLLVYPEGTRRDPAAPPKFLQNPQAWNDGSGRGHTARTGVDDVGFLAALIDQLVATHHVDPARLYMAGFSNGAAMTFRAGAELAGRVAAIGPVSGHCWVSPQATDTPVPALMIFGGVDPLNPVDGGEVKTPWGTVEYHPPILESFDRWRAFCGCAGSPTRSEAIPGVRSFQAAECPGGGAVGCMIVEDLGHHWPGGPRLLPPWVAGPASTRLDGASALWEFFQSHARR
ncbi:MAG: PHB depolymerase family esterase [Gemmatimonadales bacterium]